MKAIIIFLLFMFNYSFSQNYKKLSLTGLDITDKGPLPRSTSGEFIYNDSNYLKKDTTKVIQGKNHESNHKKETTDNLLFEDKLIKKP